MSCDTVDQVVAAVKESPVCISLQLDESTNVSNISHLVVFVRYVESDSMCDEFLLCKALALTTKAADIFKIIDEFFKKHDIAWTKVGSVCTDDASSMLDHQSGIVALVKAVVPDIISVHCVLHRYALASKTLPRVFKEVLSTVVKAVIRGKALQLRQFKTFCEEVGANFSVLLLHMEVR